MIERPEFLFPPQVPTPTSPQYLQMIAEIAQQNRGMEWFFLGVSLLCLVPVVLFSVKGVWNLFQSKSDSVIWGIAAGNLVVAAIAFSISWYVGSPFRPYRLTPADYAKYRVVEARVTDLGMVLTQKPSHDKSRKIRWASVAPLAAEGWTPSIFVSSDRLFSQPRKGEEVHLNDVVYMGLDPAGELPPLFLGFRRAVR